MKKGAGVLIIKNGKVLLVRAKKDSKQPDGQISFPGGRIENGETEIETATRELTEETGLIASELIDFPGSYVEATVPTKTGDLEMSFKVFLVKDFSGELIENSETEPFWVSIEEARAMKLYGKNNQILEAAIQFIKQ